MTQKGWYSKRSLIALLLLVSFVSVQTAIAMDFHHHEDGGGPHSHCCPACHAGHLPALILNRVELAAPSAEEWRTTLDDPALAGSYTDVSHPSRGPPE